MSNQINWQPKHLRDDVVTLFPLKAPDFEALYLVASDPLIWEQHPASNRYQKEVFRSFFDKALQSNSAFLIRHSKNNDIVGSSRFYDYNHNQQTVAIGYTFLARKFWGTAVNTSLKKLMIGYAFEQQIEKVLFHVGVANIRSQKAMSKIGAAKTRAYVKEDEGKISHHIEFAIDRKNWKPVKKIIE